jgi:RNA polymerase sigma factor (sigma-70 family)
MRQGQLRAVLGYLNQIANPDGGCPDDAQLLDRWRKQRDPAALEVLVWRHGAMIWNVCRRILGRQQDAEDAFQATFLTFLRKANTIGQGRFLGSWLYKVAYRTALAARAASAKYTAFEKLKADFPQAAASEEDAWSELAPVLDEEVHRLPEKYRLPFVLCYLEGKTTDEAAEDLGCPRGTVGTRLAWARERLRSRLTQRGLALSVAGLATLLAEKAATASVPTPLVWSTVKAATFSTAGKALAAGVISARAAALSQGVVHAMFMTNLQTSALVLIVVGILGSGAGLLAHHALADRTERTQTAEVKQPVVRAAAGTPPNWDARNQAEEEYPVFAEVNSAPAAPDQGGKEIDPRQLVGTVVQVDRDGKRLGLVVPSKVEGEASRKEIEITNRTQLVFSNVGPNEANLTAGYRATVWLEKDGNNVAARMHLSGQRITKNDPPLACPVVAVAADGKGITLGKPGKGGPGQNIAIRFTDNSRVFFSNVPRDGARMRAGYEGRVWLEGGSQDTAKSVTFFGTADAVPAKGEKSADWSGKVSGLAGNGKILVVEQLPIKGAVPATFEIKLTDATRESYHGVAADEAKPVVGYLVQIWLAEGSRDTAAQVRFFRNDPRKRVDARILAVSTDGGRVTVASASNAQGEPAPREIMITGRTRMVFSNVRPGGAQLTQGYDIRGWLVEGSEDIAEELMVSRSDKTDDKTEK